MAAYTNKQIVDAYIAAGFNKRKAAAILNLKPQTISLLLNKREGLKEMFKQAEDMRIDIAEDVLQELIEFRDFRAVKFFLETQGRKKGYGQKIEITKEDGDRKFSSVRIVNGDKIIELK